MDSPHLYWCSVILIILLPLLWFQWKSKRAPALPLPPGPTAWHIVRNLFQLAKRPHESLCKFSQKYGPLMSFRLAMRRIVVASTPAMAKEILKTHDHIFVGRTVIEATKVFSHHKSSLVWGEHGPHWRYLRRITTVELFSPQRLEAQEHLRRGEVFHTVRLIFESKGKAVNIEQMAFFNIMNVLGKMIFGTSLIDPFNPASVGLKDTIGKTVKLLGTANLSDFYPLFRLVDPQSVCRQMAKHMKRLHDFIDLFIQDRIATKNIKRQQNDSHKDFLDVLLDMRTEDFTLFDVRALIFELLIAGTDSTTTTIEWVMTELIRHPEKMKRVQQELDGVVGLVRKVEAYDINRFSYLNAVVKETFRLHPTVPLLLPLKAGKDCEIEGYMIPKDAHVLVNLWAIGRDPATWKEPLEFMPERFLEGENSEIDYRRHNFELIPFGAGRRLCVGHPFAMRMLHLVLASFIHSFEWTFPHGMSREQMDMRDEFGLVLKKASKLIAIPKPRLPHHIY
ncbi:hypothetical protein SUGI_0724680 [Cryptomeria japonica]|uniref:probable (S)-N-methylcoclaurine 3'-hydroxylase isozyme 2 n=1 Tax=Cryptomeria japonica TaxID=3369 RepID=UPI0024149334|nr:probable (S)-N-methylcoclaurine 3'-hydroxylase isozyme 2 [Cryptomeria japonica]GLJ36125.1 hypothetical protein SUGI_0724680 [Cryptomeria japonica]